MNNITNWTFNLVREPIMYDQLTVEQCLRACENYYFNVSYGFVWCFIIGYLCHCLTIIVLGCNLFTPKMRTSIMAGLKIAHSTLVLTGIFWYLFLL